MAVLLLGGCVGFSPDGGFTAVQSLTKERIGKDVEWARDDTGVHSARSLVDQLLAAPLTVDDAVQVALLNNRGLQATYAELGIAESDLVQAGRLRNPGFSFARLRRGDELAIERLVMVDFLGLLTMPLAVRLERQRFAQTQGRVAMEVLQVAAETRRAYLNAVSAQETVNYMEQVKLAAAASAELARRMAAVGNWSRLNQAREQLFYAETTAQLARARQTAIGERERLIRLMGLWGEDTRFRLPQRLPDLPGAPQEAADLEARALRDRLDVQGAKQDAERIAASLGLTRATGFINVLEIGYQHNSETGQPTQRGYEIEVRLPLFDWGGARTAKAEHIYMQSVNRAAATAVNARSEVREAYSAYRTAFDLARHYRDEIVPLRKKISDENLLRYNGMLISVFELLADSRAQVLSVNAYIEALRNFWVAESGLQMALTGSSRGGPAPSLGAQTPAMSGGAAAGH
ncbi:MAG: TolC family protein [Betaproteobacteria bacterium]